MADVLPTIVLVHGAWHTPPNYIKFSDALAVAGFTVECPSLPSCNNASPPNASFAEDVACVRNVVEKLVSEGKQVLMVMHSYGGAVGTEAVTQDVTRSNRALAGQSGGVIHLLYQCAYMLCPGSKIMDVVKEAGFLPYWSEYINNFDDGTCFPIDPAAMFFGGDDIFDIESALSYLVRFPLSALDAVVEGACWKTVPVTYLYTRKDGAVPTQYQDIMIRCVEDEGMVIRKLYYDTSHSIFITKEKEMVDVALEAARDIRNIK